MARLPNGSRASYKGDQPEAQARTHILGRSRWVVSSPVQHPRRATTVDPESARDRYLHANRYRAEREWKRYEGTPQRDLFRELRERFLSRRSRADAWVLDLGSGPGRFTPFLGKMGSRVVALDLSRVALEYLAEAWPRATISRPSPDRVRGDGARPPLAPARFGTVAALGNTLGFAGSEAPSLLDAAQSLVAPGGQLLVELAPGPGERSRYLARLPARSVGRLLRSPPAAVLPRVEREGFLSEPGRRRPPGSFRRYTVPELTAELVRAGWAMLEVLAVAPVLGPDAERVAAARPEPKSWTHLLTIEEEFGRRPDRWVRAASVLLAAEKPLRG